jgi:hypothetical protein
MGRPAASDQAQHGSLDAGRARLKFYILGFSCKFDYF